MKTYAKIATAALVGIAATISILHMREGAPPVAETASITAEADGNDPLRAELRRCQALGAEAATDQRCLNAWATKRSRFFRSSVSHYPQLQSDRPPAAVDSAPGPSDAGDRHATTLREER